MGVCFGRGEFEFCDEPIDFVDNEDWAEAVGPRLSEDSYCLKVKQ